MAGTLENTQHTASAAPSTIRHLRALAQANLSQIEAEDTIEAQQQAASQRDLQKYAKTKRKDRSKEAISSSQEAKHGKLRSAQDVLDRLQHDPAFNLAEYRIGYLERFEGIKEMAARSWISESTDEDWIPQHRIKYVKRVIGEEDGDIVWDREARIDRIFGSGNTVNASREDDESEFGGVAIS